MLSEEKRIYASGEEVVVGYHYEQGSFVPIAQEVDGDLQYIVTDHLGTPKEVYSEEGELIWSAKHELWGRVNKTAHLHAANDNGAYTDCIIRFQGQIEDEESGLYYNRFRYYDPESGNYTQADPISLNGGVRLHGYVDNPLYWFDPFGLARSRAGRASTLKRTLADNNTSKAVKGWIQQELNRGRTFSNMKLPPGMDLAHWRGYESAKGFNYKFSDLNTIFLHKLQHKYDNYGRKNKLGASKKC